MTLIRGHRKQAGGLRKRWRKARHFEEFAADAIHDLPFVFRPRVYTGQGEG
jgi:hypothetical protein